MVNNNLVSRVHARIEYRRAKFVLVDQSTNGTFIRAENRRKMYLRRRGDAAIWARAHEPRPHRTPW
ncbi:MAG: FHA domain-containing protein [Pseudomonadota bacterium]|nr:FHA domain-containing protein [Pseudomonadota bacterium]